jgi:hypothetical protein
MDTDENGFCHRDTEAQRGTGIFIRKAGRQEQKCQGNVCQGNNFHSVDTHSSDMKIFCGFFATETQRHRGARGFLSGKQEGRNRSVRGMFVRGIISIPLTHIPLT